MSVHVRRILDVVALPFYPLDKVILPSEELAAPFPCCIRPFKGNFVRLRSSIAVRRVEALADRGNGRSAGGSGKVVVSMVSVDRLLINEVGVSSVVAYDEDDVTLLV